MSNLSRRLLTGVIAGLIFLGAIYVGALGYSLLFGLVVILGLWEFFDLVEKGGFKAQRFMGLIVGMSLYVTDILVHLYDKPVELMLIPLLILFFTLPVELYRNRENPFLNIALGLLALLYIALPFTLLNHVVYADAYNPSYNPSFLFAFFLLIWMGDTGAYFSGTYFGKTKLFERVSPKKTWEGTLGGVTLSMCFAIGLSFLFPVLNTWQWIVLSLISTVAGTYGDLVESLLKRSVGVKDSGNILPGHGGVLDRFDSVILATPPAFVFLQLIF